MYSQNFTNIVKDGQTAVWQSLLDKISIKKIKKKEIIFHEQDASNYLYYLLAGRLEVFLTSEDGKTLVVNDLTSGCLFGELGLILEEPRSASVRAVVPSEIQVISKQIFFNELENNHPLSVCLLATLAKRVIDLSDNLRSMALEDVYCRVRLLLQNLSTPDLTPGTVLDKVTHKTIASHVGSSREMVSKIFKELINGEYIKVTSDKIQILKPLPKKF